MAVECRSRYYSGVLKARQLLGKYRIAGRLGEGGFATVYRAYDTIEGIPVALKIPHPRLVTKDVLESFRKEVRLTANLDHPNILPIKNAEFVGKQFVIAYPLGEGTLDQRLKRRLATRTALHYAEQMLEALAFAHRHRIIHCDIKPDNFILFPGGRVRLADFGIAKVARSTALLNAKGTGTIKVELTGQDGMIHIDVLDYGVGIPESHLDILTGKTTAVLSTIIKSDIYSAFCSIRVEKDQIFVEMVEEEQLRHIRGNGKVSILTIDPSNVDRWFCIQGAIIVNDNVASSHRLSVNKIILFPKPA